MIVALITMSLATLRTVLYEKKARILRQGRLILPNGNRKLMSHTCNKALKRGCTKHFIWPHIMGF